jgi:hypothetical protein
MAVFALVIFVSDSSVRADSPVLKSAFLGPQQWGESPRNAEQIGIELQQHFAAVLAILTAQSPVGLDDAMDRLERRSATTWSATRRSLVRSGLEARRQQQLKRLAEYAARGVFPQNEGQAEQPVPIFVDKHGTHCAVGYLMHRDGWDDAVADVVSTNNLIRVPDVRSGGLVAWVTQSGLTQEEAALIQPAYAPPEFQATLVDFQTPGTVVSQFGMNITDLDVRQFSYLFEYNKFDPAIPIEQAYAQGVAGVNSDGVNYPEPENVGIALGEGDYVSTGGPYWNNTLDQWLFIGSRFVSMGSPADGDNAIIFKISYDVAIEGGVTDQFGLTSSGHFNFNFAFDGGDFKVVTEVVGVGFDGEVSLQSGGDFPDILVGTDIMTVDRAEYSATTYAVALNQADFTSLFHEFTTVPEPVHGTACLFLIIAAWTIRGRANSFQYIA